MRDYRRAAHTVYALHYHFVFITKYRKPVLRGEIGTDVRDMIREICRTVDVEILQGHIRPDHVHWLLSVPPHLAPSRVMQRIKGRRRITCFKIVGNCGRNSGGGIYGRGGIS
ncbi:MAG: IS200/IS605 family transposase [Cyanobacteria bacterium]|nr:IS200/IS605 family transposase [Cyanobacteriota bacterium]